MKTTLARLMGLATALLLAGAPGLSAQMQTPLTEPNLLGQPVPQQIRITGGGPVLQILPGPAPYARQAMQFMRSLPGEIPQPKMQQMQKIARMGPFSNRTATIAGDFNATFTDRGMSGDMVDGTAEFTTQDGTQWRMVLTGVSPDGDPPMEPHWGGVATNRRLHGNSGHHNPFVPTVNSIAMWGTADIFRNGEKVQDAAPVHIMLTSDTRGENFNYQCRDCVGNAMRELHVILIPKGDTDEYDAPGGFLHIMWKDANFQMMRAG